MIDIEKECRDLPVVEFAAGTQILEEGLLSGSLLFLKSGTLEVSRDKVVIGEISEAGMVLGEVAILLDRPHIGTVTAKTSASIYLAEDAGEFLHDHPVVNLFIARALAKKVDSMSCYIADLKQQYAGEEGHLGMVHEVLESLVHLKH